MEREFVGRLPVRVALQALSQDDLFQVLTKLGAIRPGHRRLSMSKTHVSKLVSLVESQALYSLKTQGAWNLQSV